MVSEIPSASRGQARSCRQCGEDYKIEPDDSAFYERIGAPAPLLCPDCRFKRRALWRNETTLYNRMCALCSRAIVSMYHPKSPYTVYCNDCWASDAWDPQAYGRAYDPGRPFLEQLKELFLAVPKWATYSSPASGPNVNSEYTNFAGGNKDCYLIFNSGPKNENCAYSRGLTTSQNTFDTYYGDGLDRIYEGVNVQKSTGVVWGKDVSDCLDSALLLNCTGCSNCFGGVNLRHASYVFFNEQLSPEAWRSRVGEIMGSYSRMEEAKLRFEELALGLPCRENSNFRSVDSAGDYIIESKDCRHSFEITGSDNVCYAFSSKWGKDNYDILGHGRKSELLYEDVGVGWGSRVWYSASVEASHDVEYSNALKSSEYCFGCDAVRNGKFMILNRQYEEEEYRALREKIIAELREAGGYGEFFPSALAPFAYNETLAQDNFPLTKEEAIRQGFRWENEIQVTTGKETLKAADIPDHIKDVPDSITGEILACIDCARNYRLIPAELAFYRRMVLPLPRKCFYCRHRDRVRRRGPMKMFDRACMQCGKDIRTTYAPDRPEIVYCETCYQQNVS